MPRLQPHTTRRLPLAITAAFGLSLLPVSAAAGGETSLSPSLTVQTVPGVSSTRSPRADRASKGKKKYRGKKITLDLQDADVRNVIRLIADVSGFNFVIAEDVQGKVTMKLKNVPWDQALDVILATKDLGMVRDGSIIRIAPTVALRAERMRALDEADSCLKSGPLKTRMVPVNYARAADLVPIVKDLLTERGRVTHDERTNTLIIKDVSCSGVFDVY